MTPKANSSADSPADPPPENSQSSSKTTPETPAGTAALGSSSGRAVGTAVLALLGPFLALAVIVLLFAGLEVSFAYRQALQEAQQNDQQIDPWPAFATKFFTSDKATRRTKILTQNNFRTVGSQTTTVAVAALGMTVIIIAGGIDLSAGTAMALCATVLALVLRDSAFGLPTALGLGESTQTVVIPILAVLACMLTGVLVGLLNGLTISLLRVVPFIVTLGTMSIWLGVGKWLGNDQPVRPRLPGGDNPVPPWLSDLLVAPPRPEWMRIWTEWSGQPVGVGVLVVLAVLLAVVLHRTVYGRYVFALGSNEATARLCGLNVPLLKMTVYTLGGLFIGVGGVMHFSRVDLGDPSSGQGLELDIIAAVVIGGGSLSGGRGSILGTLLGALIVRFIRTSCTILGFPAAVQDILLGVIIIASVALDQFRQQRQAA